MKAIRYFNYAVTDQFTGLNGKGEAVIPEYIVCHQCHERMYAQRAAMIYDENYDGFECDYCRLDGTENDIIYACTNKSRKCPLAKKKDACVQCAIKSYNSNLQDCVFNINYENYNGSDEISQNSNQVASETPLYPIVINAYTEEAYQMFTNDNMKINSIVSYMDVITNANPITIGNGANQQAENTVSQSHANRISEINHTTQVTTENEISLTPRTDTHNKHFQANKPPLVAIKPKDKRRGVKRKLLSPLDSITTPIAVITKKTSTTNKDADPTN